MKTYDELVQQWNNCHGKGQILVDSSHPLRMYLNINQNGNKELLVPIPKYENRFKNTAAIGVSNYKNQDSKYLAIELLQPALEAEYISLCFDLIESSRPYSSSSDSLHALLNTFKKWFFLLSDPRREILPEKEIRGLLGELQFIMDELDSGISEDRLIDAWKTHRDASRDFIFDDTWSEVKTIEPTKDYCTISSLDQLDHDNSGYLVVYRLEKTDEKNPFGISLNGMVEKVRNRLGFQAETELNQKLISKGYAHHKQYDQLLFAFTGKARYLVDETFPCIPKSMLSSAIIRADYDIRLSKIERWRMNGQ